MSRVFSRLFEVLAGSSQSELRKHIQFLKAENEILRSRIKGRLQLTPKERTRLVRLGQPLGSAIKGIITIVSPRTFTRWVNGTSRKKKAAIKLGRRRTPEEIRELVLRLARETDWGYTRLHGELKKLGVKLSRSAVMGILRDAGVPTGPERSEGTWDKFLTAHAKTLWACDFVSHRILTPSGWKQAFVLVFIHIQSRRVYATPATTKPSGDWAANQVQAFAQAMRRTKHRPGMLIHDRDAKFSPAFAEALRDWGIKPHPLPPRSPNLNAFAERFIQTLRHECLDRFIVVGTGHLDRLVQGFVAYYNGQRPHSRLEHRAPLGPAPPEGTKDVKSRDIVCQEHLGGVVKHYYRRAA